MVVTVHDVVPLKRVGEYLRLGLRFRLRCLAVQRAARVIVPTRAVADDTMRTLEIPAERIAVVGMAAAPTLHRRTEEEVAKVRESVRASRAVSAVGRPAQTTGAAQADRRARRREADDAAGARRRRRPLGA